MFHTNNTFLHGYNRQPQINVSFTSWMRRRGAPQKLIHKLTVSGLNSVKHLYDINISDVEGLAKEWNLTIAEKIKFRSILSSLPKQNAKHHNSDINTYHRKQINNTNWNKQSINLNTNMSYHSGQFTRIHSGKIVIKRIHPFKLRSCHTKQKTRKTLTYHPKGFRSTGKIYQELDQGWWLCCREKGRNAPGCKTEWIGMYVVIIMIVVTGCQKYYPCCNGTANSPGCAESDVCGDYYDCCKGLKNSRGCIVAWSCCKNRNRYSKVCKSKSFK
eukprot:151395_1